MTGLEGIKDLLYAYGLALYYGTFVAFSQLTDIIRNGPRKVFTIKDHSEIPDVLKDPELGEHSFIQLEDVKLHIVSKGDPSKPLMLFVHGFPEFWYAWRHQLKEFSKAYRVVAVDMRGYSESDKPTGVHNYTVDKLTKDIQQLIHALGYQQCILVAHDWGAIVAWATTAFYPDVVSKLIVMNGPHPRASDRLLYTSSTQFKKSWYVYFFQLPWLPEVVHMTHDRRMLASTLVSKKLGARKGTFTSQDILAYKHAFRTKKHFTCPINYYRGLVRYPKVLAAVNVVRVPTLIVWGVNDGALDKEVATLSSEYVKDYKCYVEFLEGSHWIQQEMPQEVNKCIWDFLAKPDHAHIVNKL